MPNLDLLLATAFQLRELLHVLDRAKVGQDACLHISWAADLLDEESARLGKG